MGEQVPDVDSQTSDLEKNDDVVVEATNQSHLSGLPLALVVAGLSTSIFLMALDSSIIATAIPRITSRFNSTGDIGWYGSAYSFAMCALQPTVGKLFTEFSMKSTFLYSLVVFEVGSVLCAAAANSPMLIVGRAIAGVGAAGCFTGAFSIIAAALPLEKRPLYIGILQSTAGFATIVGPVIGGALTQYASWRWCFWINLPVGLIPIFALGFFFRSASATSTKKIPILQRITKIDLIGAALFIPAVIMELLALQWGGTTYAWKSATIIGLFVGGAGLGTIFIIWQLRKGDSAMIPPRLISQRTLLFACLTEFFVMGAVYTSIYYMPEWFQVVKAASPIRSGVMFLPQALSDLVAAIATGALLRFIGYPNAPVLLGTALMSIAAGLFSTLSPDTNHQHWIVYLVLQGLGAGMTLSMPYVSTQIVLKPEDIPVGVSLIQCTQFFGASVFLAVAQSIFQNKLIHHLESVGVGSKDIADILHAGSGDVRRLVSDKLLPDVVNAYNDAITTTFYAAIGLAVFTFLVSFGMPWKSVKPKKDS